MNHTTEIGAGHVGLIAGVSSADMGNWVVRLDTAEQRISALRPGEMSVCEPGLEEFMARVVDASRVSFATSYAEGLKGAESVFIAAGTPARVDGEAGLRYVDEATGSIAHRMWTSRFSPARVAA